MIMRERLRDGLEAWRCICSRLVQRLKMEIDELRVRMTGRIALQSVWTFELLIGGERHRRCCSGESRCEGRSTSPGFASNRSKRRC